MSGSLLLSHLRDLRSEPIQGVRVRIDGFGMVDHRLAIPARRYPNLLGIAWLDDIAAAGVSAVGVQPLRLIFCSISVRRLYSSLSDGAEACCDSFRVVVTGLVFLRLSRDLRRDHLGLLLVLNLVTLLREVTTLAGAHEVGVKFLLEKKKLLLFHALFCGLWIGVKVEVLPFPLDSQRPPAHSISGHGPYARPFERLGNTLGCGYTTCRGL